MMRKYKLNKIIKNTKYGKREETGIINLNVKYAREKVRKNRKIKKAEYLQ